MSFYWSQRIGSTSHPSQSVTVQSTSSATWAKKRGAVAGLETLKDLADAVGVMVLLLVSVCGVSRQLSRR
jgi:hypothetical protein